MDISVVIPLLNEDESLQELHDWIAKVMQSNRYLYEIIFIDDGSTDRSWQVIEELSQRKQVRKRNSFSEEITGNHKLWMLVLNWHKVML